MQQSPQKLAFGLARTWVQQAPKGSRNILTPYRHFASLPEEVKIPVPWGHVAGKWWNRGNSDPILAIHGWIGNSTNFDHLISLLPEDLSFLAIDLPGFGLSSHLPPGTYYHRFAYVVLIRRIVTYYKWVKLSLLGHAMGGSIAFLYSSLYPETIKSLSIINPPMAPIPIDVAKYIEVGGALIDQFLEIDYHLSSAEPRTFFSKEEIMEISMDVFENQLPKETVEKVLERNMRCHSKEECYFSHDRRLKDSRLSGFTHSEIQDLAANLKTHVLLIKYDQSSYFMPKEDFNTFWEIIEKNAISAKMHILEGKRFSFLKNPTKASLILNEHLRQYHLVSEK